VLDHNGMGWNMTEAIDVVVEKAFREFSSLSAKHIDSLVCVARGNDLEEATEYLHIEEDSFKKLKKGIRKMLGLRTERELLVTAVAYGLVRRLDFKFPGDIDNLDPTQAELVGLFGHGFTLTQIAKDFLGISGSSVTGKRTRIQDYLRSTSLDQLRAFEVWYVMRDDTDGYRQKYDSHLVEVSR